MAFDEMKLQYAMVIDIMGDSHRKMKEYAEAVEEYRMAACLLDEFAKDDNGIALVPYLATVYLHLGDIYFRKKEYGTAAEYYQKAEQTAAELISGKWKDEESLNMILICREKIGYVSFYRHQPVRALHWYLAALQTAKELYNLSGTDADLIKIADVYTSIGNIDQEHGTGYRYLLKALDIWKYLKEKNPDNEEYEYIFMYKELAVLLMKKIHHFE